MSTSATLALEGSDPPITAGTQTTLTALVTNTGTAADEFVLSARNIDPAWLTFRPPLLPLAPGQQGSLTVLLNVPADAVVPPGVPLLRLLAQSNGEVVAETPLSTTAVATATTVPFTPISAAGREVTAPSRAVPAAILAAGGIAAALIVLLGVLFYRHAHQQALPASPASLSCGKPSTQVASLLSDDTTTAIRLSNPDFSDMRVLHTEPAAVLPGLFDSLLSLSDDNSRIAYVTANNESMDEAHLWTISATAPGQPQELAHVSTGFWAVRPAWSPDNQQVAFLALDPTLAAQHKTQLVLWIAGPNGQLRQLSNLPQLRPEDFYGDHKTPMCWAADNRTLIFDGVQGQNLTSGQAGVTTVTGTATTSASAPATGNAVIASPITVQADGPAPTGPQLQVQVNTLTGAVQVVPAVVKLSPAAFNTGTPNKPTGSACAMPVFSQNDPAWRFELMQSAGDQIGNYGCAMTSTSMILNFYGASMTPAALNACLKGAADPLYWTQAPGCVNGLVNGGNRVNFSWPVLDQTLSNGPAIVGMLRGQTGMHFVVVTAGGGGNAAGYAVTDPWDATTTKTLQTFFNAGYNPAWIVTYSGTTRNCQRLVPPAKQAGVAVTGVTDGGVYRTPVQLSVSGDPTLLVSANVLNLSLDDFGTVQSNGTPVAVTPASGGAVIGNPGGNTSAGGTSQTSSGTAAGSSLATSTTIVATSAASSSTISVASTTSTVTTASTSAVATSSHTVATFTLITVTYHVPHFFITPVVIPPNRPFPFVPLTAASVLSQEGIYQLITQAKVSSAAQLTVTKFIIDHTPPHIDVLWLPGGAQANVSPGPADVRLAQQLGPAKLQAPLTNTLDQTSSPAIPQSIGPIHLQVQALDNLSGVISIEYQLDGAPWGTYSNDVSFQQVLTVGAPGNHVLSVRATDLAGNTSPVQTYRFAVLTGPPASATPTATATATPTVTATVSASATPTAVPTPTATATVPPTSVTKATLQVTASTAVGAATALPPVAAPTAVPTEAAASPTPSPLPTSAPTMTATVVPTSTLTVTATVTPTSTPTVTASVTPTNTPTMTATVTPTSTATATPTASATVGVARLAFRPSSLSFATQAPQTQSQPATVTAVNTGTAPLSFIGIAINGGGGAFVYAQNDCINYDATHPLAPNATCTVGIIFYPPGVGAYTGSLDFTDSGVGSPQHVALSGVAANPPTPTATPCAPIAQASISASLFTPSSGNPYVVVRWSSVPGCPPYVGTITAQVAIGAAPYATYAVSQPAGSLADSKMGCYSGAILYTLTLRDNTGKTVTATTRVTDNCSQIN